MELFDDDEEPLRLFDDDEEDDVLRLDGVTKQQLKSKAEDLDEKSKALKRLIEKIDVMEVEPDIHHIHQDPDMRILFEDKLYEKDEDFEEDLREAWETLKPQLIDAGVRTKEELHHFIERAEPHVKEAFETVKGKMHNFTDAVKDKWHEVQPVLREKFKHSWEKLKQAI